MLGRTKSCLLAGGGGFFCRLSSKMDYDRRHFLVCLIYVLGSECGILRVLERNGNFALLIFDVITTLPLSFFGDIMTLICLHCPPSSCNI